MRCRERVLEEVSGKDDSGGGEPEPESMQVLAEFCLPVGSREATVKASGNLRDAERCTVPEEVGSAV